MSLFFNTTLKRSGSDTYKAGIIIFGNNLMRKLKVFNQEKIIETLINLLDALGKEFFSGASVV